MSDPEPGTWYRHYLGSVYYVMALGEIEATLERVVIYRSQAPACRVWVRPMREWSEIMPSHGPRFALHNAALVVETRP